MKIPEKQGAVLPAVSETEQAFDVLEDALNRCEHEPMQTPEVYAALKLLAPRSKEQWPFHQFWKSLETRPDELAVHRTGRWQMARAALNGIRLRVH